MLSCPTYQLQGLCSYPEKAHMQYPGNTQEWETNTEPRDNTSKQRETLMKPRLLQVFTVFINSKAENGLCQFKFWLWLNLNNLKSDPLSTSQKLQGVTIPAFIYLNKSISSRLRSVIYILQSFPRERPLEKAHFKTHLSTPFTSLRQSSSPWPLLRPY